MSELIAKAAAGKILLAAFAFLAMRVVAESAAYADLGEFANVNSELWDTRGHAVVAVSRESAASAAGFEPRGRISVAVGGDVDPRGRDFGESAAIRFRSDKPRGVIIHFF